MAKPPSINLLKEADLQIPEGAINGAGLRDVFRRLYFQLNPYFDAINKLGAKGITLPENFRCDLVTAKFSHGVPQNVALKNIPKANGAVILGWDGQKPLGFPMVQMVAGTGRPQVAITVWFENTMATNVPVALLLLETGQQSSRTPPTTSGGGGGGGGTPTANRVWGHAWANETTTLGSAGLHRVLITVAGSVTSISPYVAFTSTAVVGNSAGIQGPIDMYVVGLSTGQGPKLTAKLLMAESVNTTTRWWVALTNATMTSVVPTIAAVAQTTKYVAWVADANVSPNFILMSGDGVNHSGIDSGVPVDMSNRNYVFSLDWTNNGSLVGTIRRSDGTVALTTVTKTTNLAPIATNKIGPWIGGVNLDAVAHNYWFTRLTLEGETDAR